MKRYPKHVLEAARRFRDVGLPAEITKSKRHYQIRVLGELVYTLHAGTKDSRPRDAANLRQAVRSTAVRHGLIA
jgi:hypothetical protein